MTTSAWRRSALSLLAWLSITSMAAAPAHAAAGDARTYEMDKVVPYEFRGDVRDLPLIYGPSTTTVPPRYRPRLTPPPQPKQVPELLAPEGEQLPIPLAPMPSPIRNFAGMNFNDACTGGQCGGGHPPDPTGDVGPNHYVQAVNTAYAIYSKTGTLLASFTENQLWSAGGVSPCNGDSQGDPIVLYDQLADRWILTHFAFASDSGPFYQCFAVSMTGDPVSGGWRLYPVRMDTGGVGKPPVGTLNDYPKFGIWPDCLYMAANGFQGVNFAGAIFASFSRADLYSGAALTSSVGFIADPTTGPYTMLPSNLLGSSASALPPPGTPNYFVSESQTSFNFEVRKFTAGADCGAGGTLGAPTNVSQTVYTVPGANIVPQPGTAILLDSLGDILLQKAQYRRVGSAESVWVVHSVRTSSSSSVRPQWAQIDVTGGVVASTPVQQQIYAPDTTLYRWMGSLAIDRQGNMAVGYSTSSGSAFPSIAYSGRLVGDPLNTLPQTEVQLVAGGGSQTNNCGGAPCHRWGDYSAMSVDPVDDCTFWYTNQYYSTPANGSSGNWQTRIGSFKFPSCTSAVTLTASPTTVAAGASVTATWSGIASPTTTDWIGLYVPGSADTAYLAWIYVSCSQVPGSAMASGSCAFPIPAGLTPGTYELRLLANNAYVRLATSNTFTVTSAAVFDYSLGNSGAINVTRGSAASNTITATLQSGPTQAVTFSASGLPSGATAGFAPGACSPTCSTMLTISTTAATPTGTFPVTVTGSPLNRTTTFNLVITAAPTLGVSPTSVAPGGIVTATWSGIPSPTTTDWIGLFLPGAANTAYISWIYVSCSQTPSGAAAAGSCPFAIPAGLAPGTYQLRLFANNGYTLLATSNSFTVNGPGGPSISASPSSVPAGGSVTVTWSGIVSPTPTDWIGLYVPGSANTAFLAWIYVSCSQAPSAAAAAGSCAFTIPSGVMPGTYEFRLLANNGYTRLATSNAVTVTTAGPGLSASPPTIAHGGTLTATWSAIPSPTTTDWIGLYAAGAPNTSYITWIYVSCSQIPGAAMASGSCPFTIPASVTPGTYELRLFSNNGYTRLATSNPLTVN